MTIRAQAGGRCRRPRTSSTRTGSPHPGHASPAHHYKQAERVADLLAEQPTTLDEPHSRHLGGKLRELRFRQGFHWAFDGSVRTGAAQASGSLPAELIVSLISVLPSALLSASMASR
ncbi:type II toxin-antitoxin system RelE/ParE family toxin [Streptomyces canus]|uniref:hypothetical protein n=1 Tax=Streptomyces canus TaxID=58343 RepID=UPI002252A288|nr:hypothetical protein [Streptomyces canus]MCX4859839.1 type II toxin-antitoxin system RelE/ParE family toxin [Streptomyces canus]WSW34945.1 type II toxin-antitoxin system RelE/ParE family toxin [Streptomyces canus]